MIPFIIPLGESSLLVECRGGWDTGGREGAIRRDSSVGLMALAVATVYKSSKKDTVRHWWRRCGRSHRSCTSSLWFNPCAASIFIMSERHTDWIWPSKKRTDLPVLLGCFFIGQLETPKRFGGNGRDRSRVVSHPQHRHRLANATEVLSQWLQLFETSAWAAFQ